VLVELHKTADGAEERLLNVSAVLNGSHWPQDDLRWSARVEPPQPWLQLPQPEGTIPPRSSSVPLLIEASAAGLRDRSDHTTVLVVDLALADDATQQLRIPVRASVRATAVASRCNVTDASDASAHATLGSLLTFRITARDVEGIPLDHGGAAFTTHVQRAATYMGVVGTTTEVGTTTVTYMGLGVYELGVLMRTLGQATVVVSLVDSNDGVASELSQAVNATTVCPPMLAPDGSSGGCGCAAGMMPSAGDVPCVPCPRGRWKAHVGNAECIQCPAASTTYEAGAKQQTACTCLPSFYADANGTCTPCPLGTRCVDPGTKIATLPLLPGYWRAIETTAVVRTCPLGPLVCVNKEANGTMACAVGSTGAFCAACAPNYIRSGSGGCALCEGSIVWSLSAAGCVLVAIVGGMLCALRRIVAGDVVDAAEDLDLMGKRPTSPRSPRSAKRREYEQEPTRLRKVLGLWARFNELSEIYQSVQATSRLVARGSQGVVKLKASPERPTSNVTCPEDMPPG
jgi:hypothetical protein